MVLLVVILVRAAMDLYTAALVGEVEHLKVLLEQGVDKEKIFGDFGMTPLIIASRNGHLALVRYLVEQGADMENTDNHLWTPLIGASDSGHLEVVRYLLEQGANRDKASIGGRTSLHCAAFYGHLETAKLLMEYGADLNMRTKHSNRLPIDFADDEEIKQAIRDEPRRRMDHGHKRATEQERHPNAATSASTQQEVGDEEEQSYKKLRLEEGTISEEGKIAEEDEDSEPSDDEDDRIV